MYFDVSIAVAGDGAISNKGGVPWELKGATAEVHKLVTTINRKDKRKNALVMGLETWASIPDEFRSHPQLQVVVVFPDDIIKRDLPEGVFSFHTLFGALTFVDFLDECGSQDDQIEKTFVFGSKDIYIEALISDFCMGIFVTKVLSYDLKCHGNIPNNLMPPQDFVLREESEVKKEDGIEYKTLVYRRMRTQ
jgi:dihydrofolate reductase